MKEQELKDRLGAVALAMLRPKRSEDPVASWEEKFFSALKTNKRFNPSLREWRKNREKEGSLQAPDQIKRELKELIWVEWKIFNNALELLLQEKEQNPNQHKAGEADFMTNVMRWNRLIRERKAFVQKQSRKSFWEK